MKLYYRLIFQDLKKNIIASMTLSVFLLLAFTLMASGLRLSGVINSSMKEINSKANPPNYLQLHKGDFDVTKLEDFVNDRDYITQFSIVDMINIDNATFYYDQGSFKNILMDNSFMTQNDEFDFILDMNNDVAIIHEGEIGVPVYYHLELGIEIGDTLSIQSNDFNYSFIVSNIIRDAQMNAALTSSKRFLINENDFSIIQNNYGSMEYSFQFLLNDDTNTIQLETEYKEAGLPSNGVGISDSIINMMNNISYGLNGYLIILVSIILITIGLLCLNYIIKTTLTNDQATLGELKAIGLSNNRIIRLYVLKYITLAFITAIIGFILSFPIVKVLSSSVVMYCGEGQNALFTQILPIIGILFLISLVYIRTRRITKKFIKHNIVDLMRKSIDKRNTKKYKLKSIGRIKNINLVIVLGELKCKYREFVLISFIFVLASLLVVIPSGLLQTVNNPSFMTYMGVGQSDIRIDLQYNDELQQQVNQLDAYLYENSLISNYEIYQVGTVQLDSDNTKLNVRVTNGDFSKFPVEYLEGRSPTNENEISFSSLYQNDFSLKLNDIISISHGDSIINYTIVGFYQDITYGGKTAKAYIDFTDTETEVYIAYVELQNPQDVSQVVSEIKETVTGSKVTPISEFVQQTMGGITESLKAIQVVTTIIALALLATITALVVQLMISNEHSDIAIKKSLGFTDKTIRTHYIARFLVVLFVTIIASTLISTSIGELLLSSLMSSMGASKITLISNNIVLYILNPLIQVSIVLAVVFLSSKSVHNYHIKDQIIE